MEQKADFVFEVKVVSQPLHFCTFSPKNTKKSAPKPKIKFGLRSHQLLKSGYKPNENQNAPITSRQRFEKLSYCLFNYKVD